jgi:L-threonylcarbamoyladenylate synthase
MRIIKTNSANFKVAVQQAIRVLRSGGVVAHPTDTVWGLAADASNAKAIRKIHAIKKSDPSKPLLLNLPSKAYLNKIGQKLCKAHKLTKKFWPGPLALIVLTKNSHSFQKNTMSRGACPERSRGVRLPAHRLSNALSRAFGKPLVTTSANLSNNPPAHSAAEVEKIFAKQKIKPDLVLDDGSKSKNQPSTIVDVSGPQAKLIRQGAISFKKIQQALE